MSANEFPDPVPVARPPPPVGTATDTIGLSLMDEQLPKRIRQRRVTSESGAL